MGLSARGIEVLLRLRQTGALAAGGAVAEIGAQQLTNTFLRAKDELAALGRAFGVATRLDLPEPSGPATGRREGRLDPHAPWARDFWTWLGFAYTAIDIDESPGSIALDLNVDAVPAQARGRFSCVTNFGTTEHVANQLNAFRIIHDLTAVGGVMLHNVPAQGMMNHGLVNYNPKFFWMLARSNGYEWLYADFDCGDTAHALPGNVVDEVARFETSIRDRQAGYSYVNAGLVIALRKTVDMAFVPPLDVNTGATTSNKALEERYWTVFRPDAFEHFIRERRSS